MRWAFLGVGVALLVAYLAYPYVTIWQLDQAVIAQNEDALEALVDWESVGAGLEQDLEALFERPDPASDDPMDELADNLIGIFTDFLIGPIVDFYTTPRGLAYLLNTQMILEDPGEALEEDFPAEETWFNHIDAASFAGPERFRVVVGYPSENGKARRDQAPMVLEFQLQNFRWQLVRVRLPLDDLAEDME
jgi:hypothetical protein